MGRNLKPYKISLHEAPDYRANCGGGEIIQRYQTRFIRSEVKELCSTKS